MADVFYHLYGSKVGYRTLDCSAPLRAVRADSAISLLNPDCRCVSDELEKHHRLHRRSNRSGEPVLWAFPWPSAPGAADAAWLVLRAGMPGAKDDHGRPTELIVSTIVDLRPANGSIDRATLEACLRFMLLGAALRTDGSAQALLDSFLRGASGAALSQSARGLIDAVAASPSAPYGCTFPDDPAAVTTPRAETTRSATLRTHAPRPAVPRGDRPKRWLQIGGVVVVVVVIVVVAVGGMRMMFGSQEADETKRLEEAMGKLPSFVRAAILAETSAGNGQVGQSYIAWRDEKVKRNDALQNMLADRAFEWFEQGKLESGSLEKPSKPSDLEQLEGELKRVGEHTLRAWLNGAVKSCSRKGPLHDLSMEPETTGTEPHTFYYYLHQLLNQQKRDELLSWSRRNQHVKTY